MKFDYAFFFLKDVVRTQMLPRMVEKNVLKLYSAEKLLHYLNVNFGDQNKKQTAQNKIRILKMGKKTFAEYLAEFQQYIRDTGFDIDNQKLKFFFFFNWLFMGASEIFGTTRYQPDDVRGNGYYLPSIMD